MFAVDQVCLTPHHGNPPCCLTARTARAVAPGLTHIGQNRRMVVCMVLSARARELGSFAVVTAWVVADRLAVLREPRDMEEAAVRHQVRHLGDRLFLVRTHSAASSFPGSEHGGVVQEDCDREVRASTDIDIP